MLAAEPSRKGRSWREPAKALSARGPLASVMVGVRVAFEKGSCRTILNGGIRIANGEKLVVSIVIFDVSYAPHSWSISHSGGVLEH